LRALSSNIVAHVLILLRLASSKWQIRFEEV